MKNLIPVRDLSKDFIKQNVSINPGIYRWWFDEEGAKILLDRMGMHSPSQDPKIQKQCIEGKTCYALYFGISKNLRKRIEWHVYQKHRDSAVKTGILSTLRQTLSALLDMDMSRAEEKVNKFIKAHCYWEWEENANYLEIEKRELSSDDYYYPLNIQDNKSLPKQYVNSLKDLRKQHKK